MNRVTKIAIVAGAVVVVAVAVFFVVSYFNSTKMAPIEIGGVLPLALSVHA